MSSVNKVIIFGNATSDPEVRYSPSGTAFCNLSIATNRAWKDKQTGDRREEAEFHRVVFSDRLAEVVGEYIKKGRPLYVEGRLKTRKWQDKEGKDVYTTEVIASDMQMLGGREAPAYAPVAAPALKAKPEAKGGFDNMDDDVPW